MADAKSVKVERSALQNIRSLDKAAYCLQIELSEQTDPFYLRMWRNSYIALLTSYRPQKFLYDSFYKFLNTNLWMNRPCWIFKVYSDSYENRHIACELDFLQKSSLE